MPPSSRRSPRARDNGVHLASQPEFVRSEIISDFQAAGVPVQPDTLGVNFMTTKQIDDAVDVLKKHGLLPPTATLG